MRLTVGFPRLRERDVFTGDGLGLALGRVCGAARYRALAEVVEEDDGGVASAHEIEVGAPPGRVFDAMVDEVDHWWDAAHSYAGDAASFSLDAGTTIRYRYSVSGHSVRGWAEAVDRVQPGQLERLKRYVETGSPVAE